MQTMESEQLVSALQTMWDENGEYLKRLLIGLTHDINLTDDLLQETWLHAHRGISGYRGGDARAWLASIAKNTFYEHKRRRWVKTEVYLDPEADYAEQSQPDSPGYLTVLELRRAIDDLAPDYRNALIMKHFGGFTYKEIAKHLGCPTGTAQSRVWTAMEKLRLTLRAIEKELPEMECSELRGLRILDYLYNALPTPESAEVESHLRECSACREEAEELRKVVGALDTFESEFKVSAIVELSDDGIPTGYTYVREPGKDEPMDVFRFEGGAMSEIKYVAVQGEELRFRDVGPSDKNPGMIKYEAQPPRPIQLRERLEMLFIARNMDPEFRAVDLGEGRWRFGPAQLIATDATVYIMAIRLPCGARFLSGTPEPSEVRTNGTSTVIWRGMLEPDLMSDFYVEYELK